MTIAGNPFGTTTRTVRTLLLLAFLSILANGTHADTLTGRVVGVTDGDTITVLDAAHQQHKVRLAGIDSPEKSQAFGQRAKQHLSRLVFDRTVAIEGSKLDRYGRLIGKVLVSSTDANLQLVRAGLAWHYKQYANEQSPTDRVLYAQAEDKRVAVTLDSGVMPHRNPPGNIAMRERASDPDRLARLVWIALVVTDLCVPAPKAEPIALAPAARNATSETPKMTVQAIPDRMHAAHLGKMRS